MIKTIEVDIPEEIIKEIDSLSEDFVIKAIREKIEREKENKLRNLLIEGYQASKEEDLDLAKDFEPADFEKL